jgi:predicted nucleic acid-binding protein
VTYLLDASVLIPLLIRGHEHHETANSWVKGKTFALCPITELAFLRTAVRIYNTRQEDARKALADLRRTDSPELIPASLFPLDAAPFPSAAKSTDWYLAELAQLHGMKLAAIDTGIEHPAAELIPENPSAQAPA